MNDLELSGSPVDYGDVNATNAKVAAVDLVDTLLLGTSHRTALVRGNLERSAFYADMHQRHDALAPESEILFNANFDASE